MEEDLTGQRIRSFSILGVLGQGSYAKVYQAYNENNGQSVAIKVLSKKISNDPHFSKYIQNEIKVMKACKGNPNIVEFIDTFKIDNSLMIVMEYCEGGSMRNYIQNMKKNGKLTQKKAVVFLKQIINGFKALHEKNIIHRDFKNDNILLNEEQVKIADFGFARQFNSNVSKTYSQVGTPITMAPEVHEGNSYGLKADVWSLGVVFYELIYGYCPYQGNSQVQIYHKSKNPPDFNGVNISPAARNFIERCLTFEQKDRISWSQVFNHDLIRGRNLDVTEPDLKLRMPQFNYSELSQFYFKKDVEMVPKKSRHRRQVEAEREIQKEEGLEQSLLYSNPFKYKQKSSKVNVTLGSKPVSKKLEVQVDKPKEKESFWQKNWFKPAEAEVGQKQKRVHILKVQNQKQESISNLSQQDNLPSFLKESLDISEEKTHMVNPNKLEKMRVETRQKARKQKAIDELQNQYMNRRDAITFVQKYFLPYIRHLSCVKVNHSNYLYLMCKQAYLELKQLQNELENKINIFGEQQSYFKEFISTPFYSKFKEQIQIDLGITGCEASEHSKKVYNPNNINKFLGAQIQNFNVRVNQNWQLFLKQMLNQYRYILMKRTCEQKHNDLKNRIITCVKVLDYFIHNRDFENLDAEIAHMNFSNEQAKFRQEIKKMKN